MKQKDIRKLCKELKNQGFNVRATRRGHLLVEREGVVVAGLAGTPSDHRSIKNSIAQLRRAGFEYAH
jgi:biotin operon repressor